MTAVPFIVAFAVLCGLAQIKAETVTGDCSGDKKGRLDVSVSKPQTTLTLKCKDSVKVTPQFSQSQFKVCTKPDCPEPPLLTDYIPGATVKTVIKNTATVEFESVPSPGKTFYIQCGDKGEEACYIVVQVDASKPAAGGDGPAGVPGGVNGPTGGGPSGSPLSCAKPGQAITIKISEKGSTAQFTCGGLTLYPVAKDSVFAEDCKKVESLKGIVRSGEAPVYTLTADEKPPKKKWCYLCASSTVDSKNPGTASNYCLVHVESSSRTQSSSAIALAAMLPCVLALLRIM